MKVRSWRSCSGCCGGGDEGGIGGGWSFGEEEKNEGERRRKGLYRIWICEGDAKNVKERGCL